MQSCETAPLVAIACGGTGGHLFPGLAVAELLRQSGCAVQLWISSKEVDHEGVAAAPAGMQVIRLPAVGFQRGNPLGFVLGLGKSLRRARLEFRRQPPCAVLAMGGFTSAAPIWTARQRGIPSFLHESNSVPGKANRWLAPWVDQAFISFPAAAQRLRCRNIVRTGTPVRTAIRTMDTAACRRSFGFDADRPVLLIAGGSQGAGAINQLLVSSLGLLSSRFPRLQFLHLTGPKDFDKVRSACQALGGTAVVRAFQSDMAAALGAASAAVSRAGASSLAEFAAAHLPAVLVPYPAAADNHQFLNARAFVESGAALLLEQDAATPGLLAGSIEKIIEPSGFRESMRSALSQWDHPDAAQQIVTRILAAIRQRDSSIAPAVPVAADSSTATEQATRSQVRTLAAA